MNIIKKAAIIMSASLILASFATGQARDSFPGPARSGDMPREGSREITFSGAGESDRKFNNGSLSLEGSYGWYMTERSLISFRQSVNNIGNRRDWSGSTLVALDYHFSQGPMRPFVGANVGLRYGGRSVGDSFAAGVQTGVKYYVSGGAFVFGRAGYSYTFDSVRDVDDAWDSGRWGYAFGTGLTF